ncbi:hypothetical protein [Candidatus Albibeggiatoa sp. nov. BB20]|uniref:hypothetical protein n=1 Tax=Candidatus Albibeggiatoa sp. nov. BB20 TaxID=3162723 RepID=UPI0033658528
MKTETILSEEQLIQQAMDALINKLGILETTRFLALKQQDKLDSVERHQQWQAGLDKDPFFDQVFGKLC